MMGQAGLRKVVLLGAAMMAGVVDSGRPAMAQAAAVQNAKDVTGDWQGTLKLPSTSLRLVLKIAKGEKGLAVQFFSIDQPQAGAMKSTTSSLDGSAFKFSLDLIGASYTGTLAADGKTMSGTWTQGGGSLPLDLVRTTKETAWEIPAAPAPLKAMALDADPAFEVATIKPSDPSVTGMQGLYVDGRNFKTKGSSLGDLVCFAYDVQMKQLVNGPDWLNKDRYDLDGLPDTEGVPNAVQLRVMVRKMLADRFKLTFHKEKRDMNAFVLTVAKGGPKMAVSDSKLPLPGMSIQPTPGGVNLILRNGSMGDVASFFQSLILDRPVVDQTGLTARYDMSLKFLPDDSQFGGRMKLPKNDAVESQPSLIDAMNQQLGLKLDPQKTAVDVIAFDHVEKPSAN